MKAKTVYLQTELLEQLTKRATEQGITVATYIRIILMSHVNNPNKDFITRSVI